MKKLIPLIALVGIWVAGCSQANAPVNVVNGFYESMKLHKVDKAVSFIHKDSPIQPFMGLFRLGVQSAKVEKYEFKKVKIDGDKAIVSGYAIIDGKRIDKDVILKKENGKWKIYNEERK